MGNTSFINVCNRTEINRTTYLYPIPIIKPQNNTRYQFPFVVFLIKEIIKHRIFICTIASDLNIHNGFPEARSKQYIGIGIGQVRSCFYPLGYAIHAHTECRLLLCFNFKNSSVFKPEVPGNYIYEI